MQGTQLTPPALGQEWPAHGGIFIGSRVINGVTHHRIIPGGTDFDLVGVGFDDQASAIADRGEVNGHSDWQAPDQEDMMLAYINAPHLFDKDDWYWTNKPYGSYCAWAVRFENGAVSYWYRYAEFRVRPVRSIIA